jgi:two-component system, OmpR family, sensor kinase
VLESVRARLALWYAAVFALLLAGFAAAVYLFFARTTRSQVDEYLAETADAVTGAAAGERSKGVSDSATVARVAREFRFRDIGVALYDGRTGALVAANVARPHPRAPQPDSVGLTPPTLDELTRAARGQDRALVTILGPAGAERVHVSALRVGHRSLVLAVTQPLRGQQRLLRQVRNVFLVSIPLGLMLATLGGYLLARTSLRPLIAMSSTAERIGATTLHERLPVANPRDELGRLAGVFNNLLGRLDRSFEQQRQFMADASHELRSPVAVISGEAELALARRDRAPEDYRDALGTVHGEARRLTRVVDDLFLLARAGAGEQPLVLSELYLDELLCDCTRALQALAARRSIVLRCEAAAEEMPFRGDEALLQRLVVNLIGNAIKYTPVGGRVRVAAVRCGLHYRVTVTDTGPGIPRELQGRIFERFFRVTERPPSVDPDERGGAGLGLPIARWIAEAHGGRVELESSDENGSSFVVELPAPS